MAKKQEELEASRIEEAKRVDHDLLAGPQQFTVMHDGDPTVIVGGADHTEAWSKYRRYFGIRQTDKEPTVMAHVGERRTEEPIVQRVMPRAEKPQGPLPMAIAP
jgi:hypothetical protein